MWQESLFPDTCAIRRGEIEEVRYRGKWLVRWKDIEGVVVQRQFSLVEEAHPFFLECVAKMREQLRRARSSTEEVGYGGAAGT